VAGAAIGLLLVLGAWQVTQSNYQYQGSLIEPPVPAADFSLRDQDGDLFRLSEQKGSAVLVFFGYTHCPDVCPVTLTEFKQIKQIMGKQADKLRFVFITVDPERDTPEKIKGFLENFDPSIRGLSAARADLEPVWQAYGVYQAKSEAASESGYLVDHTARIYVIDPQGNWKLTYPFSTEVDKIVSDLRHLLREQ
jgi:protein SCO1/2